MIPIVYEINNNFNGGNRMNELLFSKLLKLLMRFESRIGLGKMYCIYSSDFIKTEVSNPAIFNEKVFELSGISHNSFNHEFQLISNPANLQDVHFQI